MYCDRCGTPFGAGVIYCSACGKRLMATPVAPAASVAGYAVPAPTTAQGRVRRNLNIVAGFWLANGVLRLVSLGGLMIFRRLVFGMGGWPGFRRWPLDFGPFLWGGILPTGIFLAMFGMVHLLLAWGLFERQPWARILGIVVGCLALIRFPLGTALGIYTLWVLLPEISGREYDAMAGVGGQAGRRGFRLESQ